MSRNCRMSKSFDLSRCRLEPLTKGNGTKAVDLGQIFAKYHRQGQTNFTLIAADTPADCQVHGHICMRSRQESLFFVALQLERLWNLILSPFTSFAPPTPAPPSSPHRESSFSGDLKLRVLFLAASLNRLLVGETELLHDELLPFPLGAGGRSWLTAPQSEGEL